MHVIAFRPDPRTRERRDGSICPKGNSATGERVHSGLPCFATADGAWFAVGYAPIRAQLPRGLAWKSNHVAPRGDA